MKPVAIALTAILGASSCAQTKAIVTEGGQAVLDCTKENAGDLATLGLQLAVSAVRSLAGGGAIDWILLGGQAEHAGLEIGTCALAKLHFQLAGSGTARSIDDPGALELERLKAKLGVSLLRGV